MSNTTQIVEWNTIDWRKIQITVFKLQKRIYQASQDGDVYRVRRLQKTLISSFYARLLATRKVTQDNQGKKTAGVDGIKTLNPKQRLQMAQKLKVTGKAKPARRVWIPKPGKTEKRPLGIPTIHDRALQALVKMAIEPEWEAKFDANSYGFRIGRSAQDAISAIFCQINQKAKWVIDADIKGCFDNINQEYLLKKLNTFPKLRRQIKSWLKAGVIDGKFQETKKGTPQGGVISPLLSNIVLDELGEIELEGNKTFKKRNPVQLIRYADDFVVFVNTKVQAEEILNKHLPKLLSKMGLNLNSEKTHIVHSSEGFNFLGYEIKQYKVGKYRAAKDGWGNNLGFKTLIKPSKKSVKTHLATIRNTIKRFQTAPQESVISKLNPIIRGWCNYYSTVVSKKTFSSCEHEVFQSLLRWGFKRNLKREKRRIFKKYFRRNESNTRNEFATEEGITLLKHSDTKIVRHIKVQGNRSPYDGDIVYWGNRLTKYPGLNARVQKLIKKQKCICPICGLKFQQGDLMEVDHIKPKVLKGKDTISNLQLLHRHCHDKKTLQDGSNGIL